GLLIRWSQVRVLPGAHCLTCTNAGQQCLGVMGGERGGEQVDTRLTQWRDERGQRGHIEKHRGKYRAIVSAGTDPPTGKRRFLKKACDTEKQAQVESTKLLNQVDEQRHPPAKILVRQLIQKWFDVEDHEDSTRERYVGLNRKYIDPVFGSMQAAKLDAELLETFYASLRKCRQLCAEKRVGAGHECRPLSSSSIRQIHFILRGAGDRGVRGGYLGVNPAALAEAPPPK